jgi:SAM-dependent methyltransferase
VDLEATHAALRDFYHASLAEHGATSSRGVGWNDPGLQRLRFALLAQVMEGSEPVSVADFGCGTGALFWYLATRLEPPPLGSYVGYDLTPGMIAAARTLFDDPRARFVVGTEVTEDTDYVLASGALTIRPGVDDEAWAAHVRDVLRTLWARARRGVAFNLLSDEKEYPNPDVYRGDPDEWAQWCMRELPGSAVALVRQFELDDFTVLVRRLP